MPNSRTRWVCSQVNTKPTLMITNLQEAYVLRQWKQKQAWKRSSIFLYMLLLWMLLSKVGMNLTHDWTSNHETMQCPISVSQKAYSGWKSVRKKCTAFTYDKNGGHTIGYKQACKLESTPWEKTLVSLAIMVCLYLDCTGHCVVYMPVLLQFGENLLLFCHLFSQVSILVTQLNNQ